MSGRHAAVQEVSSDMDKVCQDLTPIYSLSQLQHKIERNEAAFSFHCPGDDVYAVASLLKVRIYLWASGGLQLISEFSFISGNYPSLSSGSLYRNAFSTPATGVMLFL